MFFYTSQDTKQAAKGFTLIELLVVIAIIGILSSVVLTSLSSARASARDNFRLRSLRQVQTALEMYYNDHGEYPAGCNGTGSWSAEYHSGCSDDYIQNLTPDYIQSLPNDPTVDPANNRGFMYYTTDSQQDYKFMSHLRLEEMRIEADEDFARYPTGCSVSPNQRTTAAVASRGLRCW